MLNKIKSQFSINDVENLSGIKAHTIRIWEKRYQLFSPERNNIGIRKYDIKDLQKIFNVSFLLDNGYKISKVAKFTEQDLASKVNELYSNTSLSNKYINQLKIVTVQFNKLKFEEVYQQLLKSKSVLEIFKDVLIPFLASIGMQWQINAINEAHEHFISTIIQQKLLIETEKIPTLNAINNKNYVLFLPKNEMHNIAILFIQYQMKLKGYSTIYIGENFSLIHLATVAKSIINPVFVTYFTILPEENLLHQFLQKITEQILIPYKSKLLVACNNSINLSKYKLVTQVNSIEDVC